MGRIICIGASYGGLATAKSLSNKLPEGWELSLIDPTSEFVYHIGLVRGIVSEDYAKRLFFSLEAFLDKRPNITHVRELVETVDPKEKAVKLKNGSTLAYDYLVVASGSTSSIPWKAKDEWTDPSTRIKEYLAETTQAIKEADTIVVSGGGALSSRKQRS
jgi:NADH dehydrogenase FAD-containing subunit